MESTLLGISSKATAALLAELGRGFQAAGGPAVTMESIGGVDAAKRVADGEKFDLVVLDQAQIAKLMVAGRIVAGSARPVVRSVAMMAGRAGARRPEIDTLGEFKAALLAAQTVGYSTGPSGVALLGMIESWGMKDAMAGKLVQAPAGRPVASLIAQGEVEIGMQQYSELMNVAGVEILGALPPGAEIISVFTAGVCAASAQPDRALRYVEFLASAEMAQVKQRQGFEAA